MVYCNSGKIFTMTLLPPAASTPRRQHRSADNLNFNHGGSGGNATTASQTNLVYPDRYGPQCATVLPFLSLSYFF